jgi:pimeloyl-ACP methyl ester carboxylesterase
MTTTSPEPDVGWTAEGREPWATRVMVTGGRAAMSVDTAELAALCARLLAAADIVAEADQRAGAIEAHVLGYTTQFVSSILTVQDRLREARFLGDGLQNLERRIRDLAADLDLQRLWYEEAEQRATTVFRPPPWRYVVALAPPKLMPTKVWLAIRGTDIVRVGGHLISTRASLEHSPLPDAIVAQRHTAALAEQLQYMNHDVLFGQVVLDGELVDVTDLTPVQRSAVGVLPWLTNVSLVPNRGRTYDDVTASPALPTRLGGQVPTLRTESDVLGRIPALEEEIARRGTGAVEILRTTATDGTRHWTVVIPGTQDPWAGGVNPMDNETNLQAVAGLRTDMAIGVAAAMHQAGIARGEPVALVGHSQGGLVATRLAADPVLGREFRISTVLTAGSPVATVKVPSGVEVLSLEHIQDPVVGLDGAPNEPAPNHVTVAVGDAEPPPAVGDPHRLPSYRTAADLLPGIQDPAVEQWLARSRDAMGVTAAGARTESMVFEIRRR